MKGSLLANHPARGWAALGVAATLFVVAALIVAFDSHEGRLSTLQYVLIAVGILTASSIPLLVLPPWPDTSSPRTALPAQPAPLVTAVAANRVYDWAHQGL